MIDTTDFGCFMKTPLPPPDNAIIATLDVCSLYTNIPQVEGIKVVCQYCDEHYQPNPPITTSILRDLTKLTLKENSFTSSKQEISNFIDFTIRFHIRNVISTRCFL